VFTEEATEHVSNLILKIMQYHRRGAKDTIGGEEVLEEGKQVLAIRKKNRKKRHCHGVMKEFLLVRAIPDISQGGKH